MAETETKSLEVQEKKELVEKEEKTVPATFFVPYTDIYETDDALTVIVEMPGVENETVNVNVEDDVLQIEGRIELGNYAEMQPLYTEYNIGHYNRKFTLASTIDKDKISGKMKDGVLTLTLPKAEQTKPRKIVIS